VTSYLKRNFYLLALPVAVIMIGTAGYRLIEGYSFLDSLYMTCITISTVGYKEIREFSGTGKVFTIGLIFLGLSTVAITASRIGQDVVAAAIRSHGKMMEQRLAKLADHFILCGYGRMGRVIARELKHSQTRFVVVDNSPDLVATLQSQGIDCVEGDSTSDEVLLRAGVQKARGLVSVLSKDADNVFVVLTARGLSPDLFILARANNDDAVPKLYRAGASKVINPYDSAGSRMAHTLVRPVVGDFMEVFSAESGVSISVEEIEVQAGSPIAGKSLRDADIRGQTTAIVVAIKSGSKGGMRFNPSGDEVIEAGDVLIAIAETEQLNRLADMARGNAH
jgi:voltage-gated potassium channel